MTIHRRLKCANLHSFRTVKKPFITEAQRKKRIRFVRAVKDVDWRRVIFSDEKRFKLDTDGPVRVWRRKGEAFVARHLQGTLKFGRGSIMVWAAIRADGTIWMQRCSDNMESDEYCEILRKSMAQGMVFPRSTRRHMMLQQDGASVHRSKVTQNFLTSHHIPVLPWPPQSPDLNLVEHVWPLFLQKLCGRSFDSKDNQAVNKIFPSPLNLHGCRNY